MNVETNKVPVDGVKMVYDHYNKDGDKRMMLIHGWTGFKEIFKDFAPLLVQKGYELVVPDTGHLPFMENPEAFLEAIVSFTSDK
ncbi:MAG: alpha/beta fold hydrolase [Candidatus Helarchaeota archaeon]